MSAPARDHAGVRVPPPVLYALPLVAAALLHAGWPLPLLPESVARALGAIVVAAGLLLGASALGLFRRARTSPLPIRPTTALVASGPYRFTRNPMYVGMAAVYLGVTLWMNSAWPLLFFPLVIVFVQRMAILPEERYLEAKFGDEYRRYRAQVRRWL